MKRLVYIIYSIEFMIKYSFLAVVVFQLTENDYRSSESELVINAQVNKNLRIASRVVLLLTPYTVQQANDTGIPPLPNVPGNNNTRSPNRAQISKPQSLFFSLFLICAL